MGLLQQIPASIADSHQMTASIWFNVGSVEATAWGGGYLLEFGNDETPSSYWEKSWLGFDFTGSYESISVFLRSRQDGVNVQSLNADQSLFENVQAQGFLYAESQRFAPGTLSDQWVHVLVAVDLSDMTGRDPVGSTFRNGATIFTTAPSYMPKCKIWINRVDRLSTTFETIYEAVSRQPGFWNGVNFSPFSSTSGSAGYCNLVAYPPADNPTYHGVASVIDPWKIAVNGYNFGMPLAAEHNTDHPSMRYAETKIWFGKYIDPALHIAKFIDTRGKPVDPVEVIAAFGQPTFHLRRNKRKKIRFDNNSGTGGPVVKVGTMSDYTQGPF